jgi:NAD(P)-dependent dehydrogenase (short-subunit alcohol dehydrogenase family)
MASFLITGCSRGLGLALVQELLSLPSSKVSKIFATARGDSPSLNELAKSSPDRVVVLILDVTNEDSVKKAAAEVESHLQDKGLDYLINNAGIAEFSPDGIASM